MPILVPPPLVEPVVRGLLGAIDVDDGPTDEQLVVLQAIVEHLWQRPDLDVRALGGADLAATIAAVDDEGARLRFYEILVALECCRHPLTEAQLVSVERAAAALGFDGPDLRLFRSMVDEGAERAKADFARFLRWSADARAEPSLIGTPIPQGEPDPALVARVEEACDNPPGTLGHAFKRFYERSGVPLPGVEFSPLNHFYVAHDMTHVIAGISTTAEAEVALSAFLMTMVDDEVNRSALLASMIVHEAGFGDAGKVKAEAGILARPGAADLLAAELARGARCTGDFSRVDHFAVAGVPLAEIRAEYGVNAPANPDDGHHFW